MCSSVHESTCTCTYSEYDCIQLHNPHLQTRAICCAPLPWGWKGSNDEPEPRSCILMLSRCFLATAYRHAVLVDAIYQARRSRAASMPINTESSNPPLSTGAGDITDTAMIGVSRHGLSTLGIPIHSSTNGEAIWYLQPAHWLRVRRYLYQGRGNSLLGWEWRCSQRNQVGEATLWGEHQ